MKNSPGQLLVGFFQQYQKNLQLKKTLSQLWQAPQGEWAVLDGLRGLAMLLVILLHCVYGVLLVTEGSLRIDWIASSPWWINKTIHARGADIIFFISAFLVTDHCLQRSKEQGWHFYHFYWRRLLRIYPLFLIALLVYLSLDQGSVEHLPSNLLMAVNFFDGQNYIVPVGWSIVVQVQFYLVLPLILGLVQKLGKPYLVITLLLLAANAIRWLVLTGENNLSEVAFYRFYTGEPFDVDYGPAMYYSLHTRLEPFVLGILLAFMISKDSAIDFREKMHASATLRLSLFVIGLLLLILPCLPNLHSPNSIIYSGDSLSYQLPYLAMHRLIFVSGFFLLTLLLLGKVSLLRPLKVLLEVPLWRTFSQLIYPIYLFHMIAIIIAAMIIFSGDKQQLIAPAYKDVFLLFLLSVPLSVILALPFHLFVEKPLTRFGLKRNGAKR